MQESFFYEVILFLLSGFSFSLASKAYALGAITGLLNSLFRPLVGTAMALCRFIFFPRDAHTSTFTLVLPCALQQSQAWGNVLQVLHQTDCIVHMEETLGVRVKPCMCLLNTDNHQTPCSEKRSLGVFCANEPGMKFQNSCVLSFSLKISLQGPWGVHCTGLPEP